MEKCAKSFQELKDRLTSTPTLTLPTDDEDFVSYSDASKLRLGSGTYAERKGDRLCIQTVERA